MDEDSDDDDEFQIAESEQEVNIEHFDFKILSSTWIESSFVCTISAWDK